MQYPSILVNFSEESGTTSFPVLESYVLSVYSSRGADAKRRLSGLPASWRRHLEKGLRHNSKKPQPLAKMWQEAGASTWRLSNQAAAVCRCTCGTRRTAEATLS